MDCTNARTWLAFRKPGELPADEPAALTAHLTACAACAAAVAGADAFDAAVGRAMTAVPVPTGLRDRLLKQAAARARTTALRKLGQAAGIAATVLVALGIVYGVFVTLRPTFHVDDLTVREDAVRDDPERAVRDWLLAANLPTDLPLDLDFRNHVFHGTERVQDRDVPVVMFQIHRPGQRPDVAKLYLVRRAQFNLGQLKDSQSSFFSGKVVRPSESQPGVVYVVLYTTESLTPFQNPPRPQL